METETERLERELAEANAEIIALKNIFYKELEDARAEITELKYQIFRMRETPNQLASRLGLPRIEHI